MTVLLWIIFLVKVVNLITPALLFATIVATAFAENASVIPVKILRSKFMVTTVSVTTLAVTDTMVNYAQVQSC